MADIKPINIHEKFSKFDKTGTPHIIGELNEQCVKLCEFKDEFVWHSHKDEDKLFMAFKSTLFVDFKDQETVEIKEGEIIIIPKRNRASPRTNGDLVFNLLFVPKETKHTGTVNSAKTLHSLEWI